MEQQVAARVAGTFFVIADVAGAAGSVLLDRDGETAIVTGAVLIFVMAIAVAMIPVALFPVLKRYSEALAQSYLVLRIVEALLLTVSAVAPLLLLTVHRQATAAGASEGPVAPALSQDDYWAGPYGQIAWGLSVVVLLSVLYRTRAVPRFISVWGLAGAPLYVAGQLLILYRVPAPLDTLTTVVTAQFAVNELALILWLLIRGLRPAPASELQPAAVPHAR